MEMHTHLEKNLSGGKTILRFNCLDVACVLKLVKIEGDEKTDEHIAAYATCPDRSCIQNSE